MLKGFIRKELIQTFRDPKLGVPLLFAPLFQLLLFGYALTNEVKNLRLDIFAKPQDVLVQEIFDKAIASRWFIPAQKHACSPIESIQSRYADAVLVAHPEGFTTGVWRHEGQLQLLINAANVLRAQAADMYIKKIAREVTAKPENKGTPPLSVSIRTLFNPSMDSTIFVVPGLMAMLLTVTVMLLSCTSVAKEKESGTFEMMISAPIQRKHIILGKTIPFVLLGIWNVFIVLLGARFFFSLPIRGSLLHFGVASLCFIFPCVMAGILLSTFVKNQQQSMMLSFIVLFIALMLSGCFFSIDNMPLFLRSLSYVNPLAHSTFLNRNILLKGGDFYFLIKHCLALLGCGGVLAFFAFKRFKISLS
jgi:ABC-2 type transport system permease protein